MNALNNVAALAELAERRLSRFIHYPLAGSDLVCEAKAFEMPQAPDLKGMELVRPLAGDRGKIDDAIAIGFAEKLPV